DRANEGSVRARPPARRGGIAFRFLGATAPECILSGGLLRLLLALTGTDADDHVAHHGLRLEGLVMVVALFLNDLVNGGEAIAGLGALLECGLEVAAVLLRGGRGDRRLQDAAHEPARAADAAVE